MTREQLSQAVNDFFSDKSRSAGETKDGLEEVRDEIDVMIESLEDGGDSDDGE